MIQYQSYNPKSPLNAVAAMWASRNEGMFPVGNVDLYQPEPDIVLGVLSDGEDDDLDIILGSPNE